MKQLISILLIGLMFCACKQKTVPKEIQIKISKIEPLARNIEWSLKKDLYRLHYTLNNHNYTSYFDKDGNWLETESEIDESDLPIAISNTLTEKLNDYSIIDIELVKTVDTKILYEIDLKKGDKIYDILFNESGKILRKKI
ncbi:PepSY-like domain-containing protein [Maribacter antarcticus]|uniref:PepSY-like domain-containing protein n=1 Tax=Maribacter antarcticus TaxID=505250 RepID=UPI00047CA67A|nr:PepSY-like domain-containing protein [Maribacter antarcticus]